jgi:transposase-like protein
MMECPDCHSTHIRKNGKRRGKQNHICVECNRQFLDRYDPPSGYSDDIKRECLKMSVNGMGFRTIERVKGVHHTTVIHWLKQVGENLPDSYAPEQVPEVGALDELETLVGAKKTRAGSGQQ